MASAWDAGRAGRWNATCPSWLRGDTTLSTKEIFCAFGTDIDSVAGWIGSYGGADSPSDIQRGIFAGEVGVPRLLRLFKKHNLRTSFFIPGHSLETFPHQCQQIVDEGHEIGAHGYTHENPIAMTPTSSN